MGSQYADPHPDTNPEALTRALSGDHIAEGDTDALAFAAALAWLRTIDEGERGSDRDRWEYLPSVKRRHYFEAGVAVVRELTSRASSAIG